MKLFKKFLKEYSDLKKNDCLRIDFTAENRKFELTHREDFNIDNTDLPTILNKEDGSYFRTVDYMERYDDEDPSNSQYQDSGIKIPT